MSFDPDQFLASTEPEKQESSFDPDKFLADTDPDKDLPDRLESMHNASSEKPENVARFDKLARQADVPYEVAKTIPDQVERKINTPDWKAFTSSAPNTSRHLAGNPVAFEQLKDDIDKLQAVEGGRKTDGVVDAFTKSVGTFDEKAQTAAVGLFSFLDAAQAKYRRPDNPNATYIARHIDRANEILDAIAGEPEGKFKRSMADRWGLGTAKFDGSEVRDQQLRTIGLKLAQMEYDNSQQEQERAQRTEILKDQAGFLMQQQKEQGAVVDPYTPAWVVAGVTDMVGQVIPAALAGAVAGPVGSGLVFTGQSVGQGYADAQQKGYGEGRALESATVTGLTEAAGEMVGLGSIRKAVEATASPIIKRVFTAMAENWSEEQATQILQDSYTAVRNGEPVEVPEYIRQLDVDEQTKQSLALLDNQVQAGVIGMFGGGAVTAAGVAAEKAVTSQQEKAGASQRVSQRTATTITNEIAAVSQMKIIKDNPQTLVETLDAMDAGEKTELYIDPAQLFQEGVSKEAFLQVMPSVTPAQLDEAIALKATIAVPRNELVVGVAGLKDSNPEFEASVVRHVKLDPNQDSMYEATTRIEGLSDELVKMAQDTVQKHGADTEYQADVDKTRNELEEMLDTGKVGDQSGNKIRVEPLMAFILTNAEEMGMKPSEFKAKFMPGTVTNKFLTGEVLNQYAGEKAHGADLTALQRAKQSVESGADPEQVRQETGWHKWEDGKWRFEIDDSQMAVKPLDKGRLADVKRGSIATVKLSSLIDHPALFNAYPFLSDVGVAVSKGFGDGGAYYPKDNYIEVGYSKDGGVNKDTLLHEIQHAIQEHEGFAVGGSSRDFMSPDTNDLLARREAANEKITAINEQLKTATGDEYQRLLTERSAFVRDAQIDGIDIMEHADGQYKRLAGEVEARDAASRASMSAEDRRANKPYISQGIPDDQVIVQFGSGEMRSEQEPIDHFMRAMRAIAEQPNEDGFVTKTSKAKDFAEIIKESSAGRFSAELVKNSRGRDYYTIYQAKTNDDGDYKVEIGKLYHLGRDAAGMSEEVNAPYFQLMPGAGQRGSSLYQMAFMWAHNNSVKMEVDPAGITAVNRLRRNEAMISSIERLESSDHFEPDASQFVGLLSKQDYERIKDEPNGTSASYEMPADIVVKLQTLKRILWQNTKELTDENEKRSVRDNNLRNLYMASAELVAKRVPEFGQMEFRDDGRFYFEGKDIDGSGDSAGRLQESYRTLIKTRAGAAGVGNTTLRRAALVSAFINAENGLGDNDGAILSGDGRGSSVSGKQGLVGVDGQGLRNHSDRLLSAVVNRANSGGFKELFYQDGVAPRGAFDTKTRDIALYARSDLSTFLHETGHLFLEIQMEMAGMENASERIVKDTDTILKWFGVKGDTAAERRSAWNNMTLEQKRANHEKFAESFEQYLFEGKAPSVELRNAFRTFKAWLKQVYKSIDQFIAGHDGAALNDDIRAVFDRMLATEQQIQEAEASRGMQALFSVRPDGITDAEWENYRQAAKESVQAAVDQLTGRSLRDLKWIKNAAGTQGKLLRKMRREAAAARREARMDARREIMSQPIYRAMQFLTAPVEGVAAANKKAKQSAEVDPARDSLLTAIAKLGGLNKEQAVSQYGIDPKDFHNRKGSIVGKPVLRADGGLSPDAMAEALSQHGYMPLNEHGQWDIQDLDDMLREEAAGNPQYSTQADYDVLMGEPPRMAIPGADQVDFVGGRLNRGDLIEMYGYSDPDVQWSKPLPKGKLFQSASLRKGTETLKKYGLTPGKLYTTREVAAALEARQREKYGSIQADDRSPESMARIARWMVAEVEFELENAGQSGVGWYSEKFQRALDIMGQKYPELLHDKNARNLMTALIAVTSDGQKVHANFKMAMDIYGNWKSSGKFITGIGHIRDSSINGNLATIQRLHDEMGPALMHEYLMQERTIKELKEIAKSNGGELKSDYQVHVMMPMAAVEFGPKLGAFYANLMGAHGYLTMDRWWSRTFNRYRGSLLTAPTRKGLDRFKELLGDPGMSDDEAIAATVAPQKAYADKNFKNGTEIEKAANTIHKAAFTELEDAPFNSSDRTFMLDSVQKAQGMLKRKGHNITIADIQAVLWYYEKRLYGEMGTRQTADVSYEEAAGRVVSESSEGAKIDVLGKQGRAGQDQESGEGSVSVGEEEFKIDGGNALYQTNDKYKPDLFVAHNLTAENLIHAAELGGLAAPSLGISRTTTGGFDGYGEITLLADKSITQTRDARTFNADVYSPRHPRAVYKIDSKALGGIYGKLKDLPGNFTYASEDEVERYGAEALAKSDAMKLLYLKDIGKEPKLKKAKVSDAVKKAAKLGLKRRWELEDSEAFQKIAADFWQADLDKYIAAIKESGGGQERINKAKTAFYGDDGKIGRHLIARLANEVETYIERDGIDSAALSSDISKQFRTKEQNDAYSQWVERTVAPALKEKRIKVSPSKTIPYTLDNIVSMMTKELRGGEGFNYGAGNIRAMNAQEIKSIQELKNRRGEIVSSKEMEALKKESQDRLMETMEQLKPFYKYDANGWGYYNDASSAIAEGPKGWRSAFNVNAQSEAIIKGYISYLKNLPTEYFETKMQRAVGLNEFKTAVVPKGISARAMAILEKNGLTVVTYDPKKEGARTAAIAKQNNLLFQPAYHGSPYKFDKFSLEHMGKGEGAQAYGWGLYFAGNKEVAEYYRQALTQTYGLLDSSGNPVKMVTQDESAALAFVQANGHDFDKGIADLKEVAKTKPRFAAAVPIVERWKADGFSFGFKAGKDGQLYKVEIPEDDTYLLWDKPLSEQPDEVRKALNDNGRTYGHYDSSATGNDLYQDLTSEFDDSQEAASKYLHSLGINGIKYLDGSSRGAGEGSYNYVIFDDSAIQILETYYQTGDDKKETSRSLEGMKMVADNGLHPDTVADLFGLSSGDELVRALLTVPDPVKEIERLTDQIMLERHADLATPEAMADAVNAAIHSEARQRMVATELAMLNRAVGKPRMVMAAAKAYATRIVDATKIRDLRPARFEASEAKAGIETEKLLANGKTAEAAQSKRNQILHGETVRQILEAKEEAEKAKAFFAKIATASNKKNVTRGRDPDVVNAITAIVAQYGYTAKKEKSALEYLKLVEQYDPEMAGILKPAVEQAMMTGKPWQDMTVEELRGLRSEVESLWYLAKRSRQMEVDGKRLDIEEAAEMLGDRLKEIGIPDEVPGEKSAITPAESAMRSLQYAGAMLRRVEQWAEAKDGKWGGAFTRLIFGPIKTAADRYRTDRAIYRDKYRALIAALPDMKRGTIEAPELNYTFGKGDQKVGMAELLHAILHTGNDSNKRKLLLGRNWASLREDGSLDTGRWDAFISRLHKEGVLKKAHWDFAQGVWDLLEETKPLAQQTHREVFGRYFDEVAANGFDTPFGAYRGGYVPAQADPGITKDAALRQALESENASMAFAFPTTAKGFTKARVEYNKPLMLDLRSLAQHIDKVLLFSHMEPAVRDVQRLLRRGDVSEPLSRVDPTAIDGVLVPWLQRSGRQAVETPAVGDGGISRVASVVRRRAGMSLMMGNVANTLQQLTGLINPLMKVKGAHMRRAAAQYLSGPQAFVESVANASPFMHDRILNEVSAINDQINDILLDPTMCEKGQAWAQKHAYFLQSALDGVIGPIVWTAAYNQSVADGMSDADAVKYADSVVRTTQGSTLPEDISRFEGGGPVAGHPLVRLFTQFAGYFNMMANTAGTELVKISQEVGLRKGAGRALGVAFYGILAPLWVAEAIAVAMRGGPDDDDDDGYLDDWIMQVVGMGAVKGVLAGVPGLGAVVMSGINRWNGNPVDDRINMSAAVGAIEGIAGTPHSIYKAIADDGDKRRAVMDVATLVSVVTGLPARPLARPVGYLVGVADDKIEPTNVVDFTRGVVTGVPSKDSKQR